MLLSDASSCGSHSAASVQVVSETISAYALTYVTSTAALSSSAGGCEIAAATCRLLHEIADRHLNKAENGLQDANAAALSRIGEVLRISDGRVEVAWANGTRSAAEPQQLFVLSGEDGIGADEVGCWKQQNPKWPMAHICHHGTDGTSSAADPQQFFVTSGKNNVGTYEFSNYELAAFISPCRTARGVGHVPVSCSSAALACRFLRQQLLHGAELCVFEHACRLSRPRCLLTPATARACTKARLPLCILTSQILAPLQEALSTDYLDSGGTHESASDATVSDADGSDSWVTDEGNDNTDDANNEVRDLDSPGLP